MDELYDESHRYVPERGTKYLSRLAGLTRGHVDLWVSRLSLFESIQDDAALSITLVDGFFEGDRFHERAFQTAMGAQ